MRSVRVYGPKTTRMSWVSHDYALRLCLPQRGGSLQGGVLDALVNVGVPGCEEVEDIGREGP